AFIVVMTKGERKIPILYAKRVVGRKMYGGQTSHIPIKVNMSGVMPVIFAGSLLSIPTVLRTIFDPDASSWVGKFLATFNYDGFSYALIYFILILGFNYFYVSITYNPLQMANDLRQNNGTIPGLRPGKPTAEFLSRTINKITLVGAVFLGMVAVFPILFSGISGMQGLALGGTSVIILVGVALETSTTLESLMAMRHHKGFLE
ncbi:MAG: preprotein translocase subunit SecY, partial [Oscillospiraceae bacterium]